MSDPWLSHVVSLTHQRQPIDLAICRRPGSGAQLLFLHGLGCTKADFQGAAQAPALANHGLTALDFPGHGDSSYPDHGSLTMEDLAALVRGVVQRMALHEVVVVGHSLGGLVGLLVAGEREPRLRGFVNVEGNLAPEDCVLTREVAGQPYPYPTDFLARLERRLAASTDPGWADYAGRFRRRVSERAFYDFSRSIVACSDGGELLCRYFALEIPTLFVHGCESRPASSLAALRASGRLVACIPDAGHFPAFSNPLAFYQTLGEFLR